MWKSLHEMTAAIVRGEVEAVVFAAEVPPFERVALRRVEINVYCKYFSVLHGEPTTPIGAHGAKQKFGYFDTGV